MNGLLSRREKLNDDLISKVSFGFSLWLIHYFNFAHIETENSELEEFFAQPR